MLYSDKVWSIEVLTATTHLSNHHPLLTPLTLEKISAMRKTAGPRYCVRTTLDFCTSYAIGSDKEITRQVSLQRLSS